MTALIMPQVKQQFFDAAGNPLAGGKLFSYIAGSSTKLATYTDSTGGTPNTNPVVLNSRGEANVWIDGATGYKFILAPSNDTDPPTSPIWTVDGVNQVPGAGGTGAVGAFTGAGSIVIPVGTDLIQTSSYGATIGLGAAFYNYDATVDAAYVTANPLTSFRNTTTGRGFRLNEGQVITPEMFGAGGKGVTSDGAAINALFAFCIGKVNLPPPLFAGTYAHSVPLVYSNPDTVNYSDDSTLCTTFNFKCTFIATGAMDHMLTFQRVNNAVLLGRIHFKGGPSVSRTSYLACNGLFMDNCAGADVLTLLTGNFLIYGIYETETAPSNNNVGSVRSVFGSRFGASSHTDTLHTANFSARADTGSANATDQRATFTADSLPPAYTDAAYRPVFLVINGYYHRVMSVDRGTSKVSITPWPSNAVASGNFRYAYGTAASVRGGDGNLINFDKVSSQVGAGALSVQCLYGGSVRELHCEGSGIAITIGNDPAATMLGLMVDRLYCESCDVDAAFLTGVPDNIHIEVASPFNINNTITAGWFSPGGATTPIYAAPSPGYWINGQTVTPARNDTNPSDLNVTLAHMQDQIWTAPTATPAFNIVAPPNEAQTRVFRKPFRMSVEVPATTVATGIPTSVTFNAPATWTVNGGATAVFSTINGIPDFSISMTFATKELFIQHLNPYASAVGGIPGVTTVGDAAATLTAYTSKMTQRWNTALTADRAVTLSTTGAKEGNRFRIVRPATGAFNLNVGTGPLKALAVGTWCAVEYDGSAWILTSYGAL